MILSSRDNLFMEVGDMCSFNFCNLSSCGNLFNTLCKMLGWSC